MNRRSITREELAPKVLAAIRSEPGCAGVNEICLTKVDIVDHGSMWHVNVLDSGDVKFEVARHVARRVQSAMQQRYDLTD